MAKSKLLTLLAEDEGVEVDQGYQGHDKFKGPLTANSCHDCKSKSVVRGRHENINSRLKIFDVLNIPFRHSNPRDKMMEKHGQYFEAVVVITQLKFLHDGEVLYGINYQANYD